MYGAAKLYTVCGVANRDSGPLEWQLVERWRKRGESRTVKKSPESQRPEQAGINRPFLLSGVKTTTDRGDCHQMVREKIELCCPLGKPPDKQCKHSTGWPDWVKRNTRLPHTSRSFLVRSIWRPVELTINPVFCLPPSIPNCLSVGRLV